MNNYTSFDLKNWLQAEVVAFKVSGTYPVLSTQP